MESLTARGPFFFSSNQDLSAQVLQWETARRWEESGHLRTTGPRRSRRTNPWGLQIPQMVESPQKKSRKHFVLGIIGKMCAQILHLRVPT